MMMRFSAKLLFQYRLDLGRQSGKRRTCEERTLLRSVTEKMAVAAAKQRGRSAEFAYENDQGVPVHLEFVGVLDMLQHGPEMEKDAVWYEIKDRLLPKERRASIVLSDQELLRRASR